MCVRLNHNKTIDTKTSDCVFNLKKKRKKEVIYGLVEAVFVSASLVIQMLWI